MIAFCVMAIKVSMRYLTLENVVLLAIVALILLISLLTISVLDVWNWIGHVLKQFGDRSKEPKRSQTRNRHGSSREVGSSSDSERSSGMQLTRRHTGNSRRKQPRPYLKTRQLQRPCRGWVILCMHLGRVLFFIFFSCKGDEAKRDCESVE